MAKEPEATDGNLPGEVAAPRAVAPVFHKKDLVDAVAAASGVKKKTAKPVVEAVLAQLGVALARGDSLNMPPLGKIAVRQTREGTRADVLTLKLRRVHPGAKGGKGGDALDAAETDADDGAEAAE